uniref:ABC transporter domain-containing protein n=1 Tax=Oryza punctata TaxID=4537 RepID=A0A0E0MGP8_ORYPU
MASAEAATAPPSASGRRSMSWGSSISQSFRQAEAEDPFGRAMSQQGHDDDEENLRWAALEKLPTYDRMRRGVIRTALLHDGDGGVAAAKDGRMELVDIQKLAAGNLGRALLDRVFQDDSERFLRRLRDRIDMVGIELPTIEVRYEQLSIQADVFVGSRALPTLTNAATNVLQGLIGRFGSSNKRTINILQEVSGIIKPSRMTLLLGPPSSGKSTLMRALTGKLDKNLKVSGDITYCGHTFSEFYPERTSAYVSQYDLHNAEMTVRETLDFSGRCLGIGARYDMLAELARRERNAGIKPDPEIDAFMKATAVQGHKTNITTDVTLKALGLDICADIIIGDEMIRGISGGQKKRVTTGEMLTGPARALFMDEISTGLDSSSTFEIVKYIGHLVHVMNETKMQKEMQIPYDKSNTHPAALTTTKYGLSSWESLRAVMSREWLLMKRNSFIYIFKVTQLIILAFMSMTVFLRTKMPSGTISDGTKFLGALTFSLITILFNGFAELQLTIKKLPVFYKHRDFLFFPAWTFGVANIVLKVPVSFVEAAVWVVLTYYVMGFAPSAGRFFRQFIAFFVTHQMAMAMFRFLGAILKTMVVANTFGMFVLLIVFIFGGFLISRNDIKPWWIWGYWASPMMYSQQAISINEFLASRWAIPNTDATIDEPTVGKAILKSKGLFTSDGGFWISIGALIGFLVLFNILYILALTYLSPGGSSNTIVSDEDSEDKTDVKIRNEQQMSQIVHNNGASNSSATSSIPMSGSRSTNQQTRSQIVLPFQPLSLCFNHVNYYVDMPAEMKEQGFTESRLQLLSDISGVFRPGVLTALVGVSGAGKTTLMDVLAGRKTSGVIEGDITLSGYPKKQETFARISGYCEQTDIHSPNVTVYESILYSAWLRLSSDVDTNTRKMFVDEVMSLVELDVLRNALVGLPGVSGLSTEQRKRLTIAVELVANPSVIFMDEPTSGLDARAAAIVMRTLLLLKRGGQVIYAGELGRHSYKLVEYFEAVPGVPKITEGYNPATWMLEVTSPIAEARLNVNFAEIYANSELYRKNQELIKELSTPPPGYQDLSFPTKYSQNFYSQCIANFWKQYRSYWKNPPYNTMRYLMTLLNGLVFGTVFWQKGTKLSSQQDLYNLLGATYAATFFLGAANCITVQPVVSIERTVFYRERAAGMYSSLSYAFAQVCVEIIYNILQGILYTTIIYAMIGYDWKADKFFYFMFFIVASFNYFTLFGMMLVACTPSAMLANILISFVLPLWNLFAGFLVVRPLIPIWWRWYYWANPVSWTIYGVVASQFGKNGDVLSVPGGSPTVVKQFLEDNLGMRHSFLGYVVLAHFGYIIVFFFIFGYAIKYFNFQKR